MLVVTTASFRTPKSPLAPLCVLADRSSADQPRYRFAQQGASALSDAELLAVVTGVAKRAEVACACGQVVNLFWQHARAARYVCIRPPFVRLHCLLSLSCQIHCPLYYDYQVCMLTNLIIQLVSQCRPISPYR